MYHAVTTRKTYCSVKLVTVLPEEKVKKKKNQQLHS